MDVSADRFLDLTHPAPAPEHSIGPRTVLDDQLRGRILAQVTGAGAFHHLVALQRIADENGGNRACPGPGYEASVAYVADVLSALGYEVSTPGYRLPKRRRRGRVTHGRNVVAQTPAGDPGRVVMAGAHLDSVRKGAGINDNGSGVAALLEIAAQLGSSPPVRNAVRFAFWGCPAATAIASSCT
jgi:aminopeptidase S